METTPPSPGGKRELLLSPEDRVDSDIRDDGLLGKAKSREQQQEEEARQKRKSSTSQKVFLNTASLLGLRAFCSLDVLVGHLFDQTKLKKKDGSPLIIDLMGGAAVTFFIVLSGFIMALAYGKRKLGTWEDTCQFMTEFCFKRMARILPIYYVSLCYGSFWLIDRFQLSAFMKDPAKDYYNLVVNVFQSITLVTSWVGSSPAWNGVSWTLSTFVFFYIVFPFLLGPLQQVRNRIPGILFCYALAVLFFLPLTWWAGSSFWETYQLCRGLPISRLPVFILGMLLGLERVQPITMKKWGRYHADGLAVFIAIIWTYCIWKATTGFFTAIQTRLLFEGLCPLLFGLWLFALTSDDAVDHSLFVRFFSLPPLKWLGNLSLSIFAFQEPTWRYINWLLLGKDYAYYGGKRIPLWVIPIDVIAVITVAWIFTKIVDEPCHRYMAQAYAKKTGETPLPNELIRLTTLETSIFLRTGSSSVLSTRSSLHDDSPIVGSIKEEGEGGEGRLIKAAVGSDDLEQGRLGGAVIASPSRPARPSIELTPGRSDDRQLGLV